jgi:subtilisin family serine protease
MATKPKVKTEHEFVYTNKFSGKKITFEPRTDEVLATFEPAAAEVASRTMMSELSLGISQLNPERGFAVLTTRALPQGNAAKQLTAHPQIANALPVMIDDEGLTRYFLPDELTVQFREGVSKKEARDLIKELGSSVVQEQRTPGYYTLSVPEGKGLFETLRAFSKREEVSFAEPSEVGINDMLDYIPGDDQFGKLWGLHNTGQAVNGIAGNADADIDMVEAWDLARGSANVIVAVIDTGADLDHPDLLANLLPRGSEDWDFADSGDGSPDDTDSHGTHVAGTAAGVNNPTGVIGVAHQCKIMPLRVNLTSGMNQNRADAIDYVAQQAQAHPGRRYVINCSWRMSGDHAGVHNAIINAVNRNVVVVFAAGNANTNIDVTPQYPAVYPETIAVAATDQRDRRASFSNYGTKVDVSAPGVNIYSSVPNNTHAFFDGTSMAAPHVAGLAALIWSRNPGLSNAQVRALIETTCDNIDALNPTFAGKLGKGRINAFRALNSTPLPPVTFQVVRRYRFPQVNNGSSSTLAFSPRFRVGLVLRPVLFFLTQQPQSEKVYFLNPLNGAVLRSVDPAGNDTIGSLEVVDGKFRVANVTWGAGSIRTIDPATGAQIGSIPAPAGRGEGMAYDGTLLYYSTGPRIYLLRPATGAVVRSFPAPGGQCQSLAYGDGYLFCGNATTGTVTILNPVSLAVRGTLTVPGAGPDSVHGLAYDARSNYLYIANQRENMIYAGLVSL